MLLGDGTLPDQNVTYEIDKFPVGESRQIPSRGGSIPRICHARID